MKDSEAAVREQYERFPYPPRDPAEESQRLVTSYVDHLDLVNYRLFAGAQVFGQTFRALVVGGGTGDATIFLAEQLRSVGGTVVQVDASEAATRVARARATARGLTNIEFVTCPIRLLADSSLGRFQYINCCGVLHHLPDAREGLAALKSALLPGGGMGLMLYGKYGRAPLYQFRDALNLVIDPSDAIEERLSLCRELIHSLPATNPLRLAANFHRLEPERVTDTELVDLFLHPRDVAFTVTEIYELVESVELRLVSFVCDGGFGDALYDPRTYASRPSLLDRICALDQRGREQMSELLLGAMVKHAFYVVEQREIVTPSPRDPATIPFLSSLYGGGPNRYFQLFCTLRDEGGPRVRITAGLVPASIDLEITPLTIDVLEAIDGQRTIGTIVERVSAQVGARTVTSGHGGEIRALVLDEVERVFEAFATFDWMLLRRVGSPAFDDLWSLGPAEAG